MRLWVFCAYKDINNEMVEISNNNTNVNHEVAFPFIKSDTMIPDSAYYPRLD